MTTRNTELFNQVADAIEAHPDRYDQGTWGGRAGVSKFLQVPSEDPLCGTAFCIAGTSLIITGDAEIRWENHGPLGWMPAMRLRGQERWDTDDMVGTAADALGLDIYTAERLFDADWRPASHLSVADALRKFGEGAGFEEVSWT